MKKIQLENNLPIFQLESLEKSSRNIHFEFWFRIGSRNDNPKYYGSAHLIEHSMLRLIVKNDLTLKEYLLQNTFEYAFLTSIDFILLRFTCPEENILNILKNIKLAFDNIQIAPKNFLQEKELIANEIEIKLGTQKKKFFDSLRENLWSPNIGHPILGDMIDISNVTVEQVKYAIQDIWSNEQLFILYTGNLSSEKVQNIFKFSEISNQEFTSSNSLLIDSKKSKLRTGKNQLVLPDSKIVNTSLVYELDSNLVSKNGLLLSLLSRLIAFGDMGFLSQELRNSAIPIYYVMTLPLSFKYEDMLIINFVTKQEYTFDIVQKIQKSIKDIDNQLNSIEPYFEIAKQGLLNDINKSQKSDFGAMNYIGQSLLYNHHLDRMNETNEKINNISFLKLKNFAKKILLDVEPAYFTANGEEISYD
ncbi:insulinase family protein [Lactobacillus murinus]|uniref:Insulinase family protein n=1 Tax=Ligilactobacillus murinus TaxID=1622 RepID=A0AAE6WG51_9LACO|nr:insulinase family protein [Ligilactobacillus murinus]MBF0759211.1 insulinase family protein [Ligilactobacillus murinus]MBF0831504.1 insulinase family protein [Ligilactobacillus murinus]NEF85874.1 insulinase family protein [Ligilactobacillus murinus]NEF97163.1 insulinase family protein [Ligilactobacillus murinus]NEG06200.1 insulinase family protein [Ligilactobacillus murinus]